MKVTSLLVEQGADTAVENNQEWTPLGTAAGRGHLEVTRMLLGKGAHIAETRQGWTLLNRAAHEGSYELAELLLENGTDVNASQDNNWGWVPLMWASVQGTSELVKLLLRNGADTRRSDDLGRGHRSIWPRKKAAIMRSKLVLKKGAEPSATDNLGRSPLILASMKGHSGVVKHLLEGGKILEEWIAIQDKISDWDALMYASYCGDLEITRLPLTVPGVGPNRKEFDGRTSLFLAAARGNSELIRVLLSSCATLHVMDRYGSTPLFAAVRKGHEEAVEMLLSLREPNINLEDGIGRSMLWWATSSGNVKVTQLVYELFQSMGMDIPLNYLEMLYSPTLINDPRDPWCDIYIRYF